MMLSHLFNLAALVVASASTMVAAQDSAWHLDYIYDLVNEELDPIVSPNAQSSHMHKVIGGSNFGASYNYDTYAAASCSSLRIQADKSNYWMPTLNWINSDGTFTPLNAHIRFYYFLGQNSPYQPVSPFPKGLRILTGNPNNKSPTGVAAFTCQINEDFSNSLALDNFNFPRDCPWGMKTELYYPPCWDGVNLYKSDGSHMAYPDNNDRDGSCPFSHPVRLPAIQLEYTWWPSNDAPGQTLSGNLAWANGDTTGYGIHGDFVNGWDLDVLGAALNSSDCITGNAMTMGDCPILGAYFDDAAALACKPALGTLNETFGNADHIAIPRLPGCNPVWANGTKPTCSPAVTGLDVTKFKGTDGAYVATGDQYKAFVWPTTPGWHNIACMKESTAISGGVSYTDSAMTSESCTATCLAQGYNFAATGEVGSWNCVCGSAINTGASVYPGMCTTACPGNSTEGCGGSYIFNVWYAPNGTVSTAAKTLSDGSELLGCYNNPSTASNGLLGAATYSFSSSSMTTEVCIAACGHLSTNWAATTGGKWCYCGNDFTWGTGSLMPTSYCTEACSGNSTETCGDYYRSSVYNITDAEIANSTVYHPAGWEGCYTDQSGHLALTNNSWTSSSLTPQTCINGCSELGYAYAGVEYANQCYCGSSVTTTTRLPVSQCNKACAGNSSAVCGGTYAMDLYSTSYSKDTTASIAATKPAGYVGCYQDTGSSVAFSSPYTFTLSALTVETCKSSCNQLGYAYAGVENANRCQCSNTAAKTTQVVSSLYCTTKCAGNSTETCGSGSTIEVYNLANMTSSTSAMPGLSASSYIGCYEDSTKGLTNYTYYNAAMTVELCTETCKDMGYKLGGVSGSYCYCGNTWTGNSVLYPAASCQTSKCAGNTTEYCGGASYAAVYNTSAAVLSYTKPTGWLSCYTDSSSSRTLQGYMYQATPMSAKACRIACNAQNYTLAGTENGKQCFCGNSIAAGAKAPTSSCSTLCSGSTNETCGGSNFIDLYNSTDATASNGISGYLGCYTDYNTLSGSSYSSDYMSVDTCNQWCYAHNYTYGGVRAGNQCRCGTTAPTLATTTAACANPCTANSTQNCGGSSTIAVYSLSAADTQKDYVVSSNSTGYVGCFHEGSTRLLPTYTFTSTSMTNQLCISNCAALGYAYAGSEYASQCYCAAKPDANSGGYQVQDADCSMACKGGGGTCGGSNLMTLWSTANATAAASTVEGLKGCYATGTFGSSPPLTYYGGYMTSDLCRRSCRNGGYSIAGLTNANTCVCGNSATYGAAVAAASCNAPCAGNSTQTCGATFSSAYSIYDTTGTGSKAPAGYPANYVGCITDYSTRVLADYTVTASGMTSSICKTTCASKGYYNYGTESGTQCYCSSSDPIVGLLADSQCTSACGGAPTEMCGGGGKLSLYSVYGQTNTTTTTSSSASSSSASVSASKSSSSASVSTTSASSSASKAASSSISSASSSKASSITAASTSASASTSKASSSSSASSSSKASSSAAASSSSSKAASSITAASTSASSSKSASASSSSVSSSKAASSSVSSAKSSSASAATTTTTALGAGDVATSGATTKASSSVSSSSAAKTSSVTASSSSSKAASSSSVASSSSKAATATTTSTSTAKASSSSTTTTSAAAATGTSLGCFTGSSTAFSNAVMTGHDSLTPSMCQVWCNANYYTYSALSGGNTCGCSNSISSLTSAASSSCSTACSGSSTTMCGGTVNNTYSVFTATAATKPVKRFDSSSASKASKIVRRERDAHSRAKRAGHVSRPAALAAERK